MRAPTAPPRHVIPVARALVAALAAPTAASACPSCFAGMDQRVLSTYYLSTLMLSLLPFAILAAIAAALWIVSRVPEAPDRDGSAGETAPL